MDLPERAATLADFLRMIRVKHGPAADAHARFLADNGIQPFHGPRRVPGADTWREFDNDTAGRSLVSWLCHQPAMHVAIGRICLVAVGRLGFLKACLEQVA